MWTYHISHEFTENGVRHKAQTQLYKLGVYLILDDDAALQFGVNPKDMVKVEKNLNKRLKNGEITDLTYGRSITVHEKDGFFEEKTET
jgi:hypothetical protein